MDYRKLRGRIVETYETLENFSKAMGMSPAAITQRLKGVTEWKTVEIAKACDLLDIELADAWLYFFIKKV